LVNFNKAFLAAQSITDILIQDSLLEPLTDRQMHQSAADWYYSLPQSILD
jgi:hypothetical protein